MSHPQYGRTGMAADMLCIVAKFIAYPLHIDIDIGIGHYCRSTQLRLRQSGINARVVNMTVASRQ